MPTVPATSAGGSSAIKGRALTVVAVGYVWKKVGEMAKEVEFRECGHIRKTISRLRIVGRGGVLLKVGAKCETDGWGEE